MAISSKKNFFYSKLFIIPLVIFLIYSSGYALSTVYQNQIIFEAIFAYIFLYPIIKIHFKEKLNIFTISFLLFLVMISVTFITNGGSNLLSYLSMFFKIIIAFGLVSIYKFEDFTKFFVNTVVIISLISLIGHYAINVQNLTLDFPIINNINSVPYAVGYIFFYITWIPERNTGVFWEPGLFATFLILALLFEILFNKNKPNLIKIILLIITIITTNSSAGYGLLLFLLCLFIVKYSTTIKNKYLRFLSIGVSLFIATLTLFNYSFIFKVLGLSENPVIQKILEDQIGEQSRLLAINHNLNLFMEQPIFGLGFGKAFQYVEYVSDTSTSTFLLAVFGMLGASYTLLWIIGILNYSNHNIILNFLILIIFILILNKEPHYNLLSTWCILFFFLKNLVKNYTNPLTLKPKLMK